MVMPQRNDGTAGHHENNHAEKSGLGRQRQVSELREVPTFQESHWLFAEEDHFHLAFDSPCYEISLLVCSNCVSDPGVCNQQFLSSSHWMLLA